MLSSDAKGIRHVGVIIDSVKKPSESNEDTNTSALAATCKAGKG